jgi:hypothetical protein
LETTGMGGGFLLTEGGKAAEDLETLLMEIVQIDLAQQLIRSQCSTALCSKENCKLLLSSILD